MIKLNLPKTVYTKLIVYDIVGRVVEKLVDNILGAGNHLIKFDARSLSTGIYFYRIETSNFTSVRKLLLIK